MLHKSGKIALKLVVDTSRFRTEFLIYSRCDRHISAASTEVRWLQILEILKRVIFQTSFFFGRCKLFLSVYRVIQEYWSQGRVLHTVIISICLAKYRSNRHYWIRSSSPEDLYTSFAQETSDLEIFELQMFAFLEIAISGCGFVFKPRATHPKKTVAGHFGSGFFGKTFPAYTDLVPKLRQRLGRQHFVSNHSDIGGSYEPYTHTHYQA